MTNLLSQEQLESWGWRVPQAVGLLLAFVGLWIRQHNPEVDHPQPKAEAKSPLKSALAGHKLDVLRVVLLNVMPAIGFYTIFVYLATWLQEVDHLQANRALEINTLSMAVMLALIPACGWLADLVPRPDLK